MRGFGKRLMRVVGGGWLTAVTIALAAVFGTASAQTTNSPLFDRSPGTSPDTTHPPAPGGPAWQGAQDGRAGSGGHNGNSDNNGAYRPYSSQNPTPYAAPYPAAPQPVFPSRSYPADRTPALRDLTQRLVSPLENAARDAGVRQQVFPAPASGPGYGR